MSKQQILILILNTVISENQTMGTEVNVEIVILKK